MTRPISHEEFLPEYEMLKKNMLQFGQSIAISRGVHPFKRKYLPFYEQMAMQLTNLLKQHTQRNFIKCFDFLFHTKGHSRTGKPYIEQLIIQSTNKVFFRESTEYRGEFQKLHKDGFAYGRVSIYNKIGLSDSKDIWFRWKSNISRYEYIEPDDELNLRAKDITFEICMQVPEEYILRFYGKTVDEYDCNAWVAFINDERHYPKKRSRKKRDFLCEIAENCKYPDTSFTFFMHGEVTQFIKEEMVSSLVSFQEEWDTTHFWGIHNIELVNAEQECDSAVKVFIDFGSSDYKIINALVKWLRYSSLPINKLIIE